MEEQKEKNTEDQQFDLGLKEPFGNKFARIKTKLINFSLIFETKRFFRKTANWLMIFAIILLNTLLINYTIYCIDKLPKQIPFLQNSLVLSSRLITTNSLKYTFLIIPFISFISVLISYKSFNKKEYLSYLVLFITVMSISAYFYNFLIIMSLSII